MKFYKLILFIIILPLTLFLDFILFALTRNCPGCGSFGQWLTSEGALSFPIVAILTEHFSRLWKGYTATKIKV